MAAAGVHAEEDITEEWKKILENKGITTDISMEGMEEISEIRDLFSHHTKDAINHIKEDMAKKKENILKEVI